MEAGVGEADSVKNGVHAEAHRTKIFDIVDLVEVCLVPGTEQRCFFQKGPVTVVFRANGVPQQAGEPTRRHRMS